MINFSETLIQRLKKSLPGKEAQKLMMPALPAVRHQTRGLVDRFSIDVKKGANEGAVLILLYKKNGKIFFPLTQRHKYEGAHSGQISFPGGKVEAFDKSVVQTALRETEEEIGIPQTSVKILGRLTDLFIIASNFNVRPVIGFVETPPNFTIDSREVAHVIEVSIEQLLDERIVEEKKIVFKNKHPLTAPYFDFDGHHVWGATAMMLAELKEILKEIG